MKKELLTILLAVAALFAPVHRALGQLNPTPSRKSASLFSFETTDLDGWISDPNGTGSNALASQNVDSSYVSDGKASMKLNLDQLSGWHDDVFDVIPRTDSPLDLSPYHAISMDVYAPDASLDPKSADDEFYEFYPVIVGSDGETDYPNRNIQSGWNHLVWDLKSGRGDGVTRISFSLNTNEIRPFTGPIYIDNVRAWSDSPSGLHSDERLIFGFDDASEIAAFDPQSAIGLSLNADKNYLSQGDGSLAVDLTGQMGWIDTVNTDAMPPIDLTTATALHLDVYVPGGTQPTDWGEIGFQVTGDGGSVEADAFGFLTDQWNALEIPLTPVQAAMLTNVTGFTVFFNSDETTGAWNGPVYIDDLRAVMPVASSVKIGDLNGDDQVNVQDATIALRIAVGLLTPTDAQKTSGDANQDGALNVQDATLILQAAVGLRTLSS